MSEPSGRSFLDDFFAALLLLGMVALAAALVWPREEATQASEGPEDAPLAAPAEADPFGQGPVDLRPSSPPELSARSPAELAETEEEPAVSGPAPEEEIAGEELETRPRE